MQHLILTGPESSGKTTLARDLAGRLGTVWVPEFARPYVAHLGRPYQLADLQAIERGQAAWEQWYAPQANKVLVCDTDLTVLAVWRNVLTEEPFGPPPPDSWRAGRRYLLCAPDFPWEPDPLREHPDQRDWLFEKYERLLAAWNLPFEVLRGTHEERLEAAIQVAYRPAV